MTDVVVAPGLPHVDEHSIVVHADEATVWDALTRGVERSFAGSAVPTITRVLGCAEQASGGPRPLATGSTMPGFRVAVAEPRRTLGLMGDHRFSHYALIFRIDVLAPHRTRVRAETRAVFPGVSGRIYRALVIGTKGHVLATRRMLAAIEARAERSKAAAA